MVNQLPPFLREELMAKHVKDEHPVGGAGNKSFTPNMDARVLLEHVGHGVPLTQILFVDRNKRAAGRRWQDHLKRLHNLDELRALRPSLHATAKNACNTDGAASDCEQPGSVDPQKVVLLRDQLAAMQLQHVPQHVQVRLVNLHAANRDEATHKKPWLINQDGQLLEDHLGGEAAVDIVIDGRSDGAVKRRLRTLRRRLSFTRNALPHINCDAEAPYLNLKSGEWTAITPDRAIPPQAEVDWLKGVARVPASWDLRLDSHSFCLYDAGVGARMPIGLSEVFATQR